MLCLLLQGMVAIVSENALCEITLTSIENFRNVTQMHSQLCLFYPMEKFTCGILQPHEGWGGEMSILSSLPCSVLACLQTGPQTDKISKSINCGRVLLEEKRQWSLALPQEDKVGTQGKIWKPTEKWAISALGRICWVRCSLCVFPQRFMCWKLV